ncbi:ATP-binding protein [Sphingomonas sp. MMS24-J13]|uniref:PAS domain-containing sensor histidine kinase n=1 Tax=Sphingomonas sp. MMS24-J13 TaxID=3238686 RepID=UPI00384FB274
MLADALGFEPTPRSRRRRVRSIFWWSAALIYCSGAVYLFVQHSATATFALYAGGATALVAIGRRVRRDRMALRAERDQFVRLLKAAPQIYWVAGPDGEIRYLSDRFTELTGMDAKRAVHDKRWKETVFPEDLPSLEGLWLNARAGATDTRSYFRMRCHDGSYRWMHSVGRPILSAEHGGITHWVGGLSEVDPELRAKHSAEAANRDLKTKIAAEGEELARVRWRFRSLFHDRNIGVIEIDLGEVQRRLDALRASGVETLPDYLDAHPEILSSLIAVARTVEVNPTLVTMLGFDDDGRYLLANAPANNRTGANLPIRSIIEALFVGVHKLSGVAHLSKPNGERLVVAYGVNISPDFTSYSTLVDITEQEEGAEMRLAAQEQLARVRKATTLGALSLSIAHELNQPLTSMRIELGSLQRSADALAHSDPFRDGLDRMARQCERLGNVVQRARDRVLDQRQAIEPISLVAIARQVPILLERELHSDAVELSLDLPPTVPTIRADAIELQQVFANLVLNAIEALRAKAADIRTVCITVEHRAARLYVRVEDNGPGIDEAHLKSLFEPFFTTKARGIGMGLQVCRAVIESLGGDLQARNCSGGGALFEFSLPIQ